MVTTRGQSNRESNGQSGTGRSSASDAGSIQGTPSQGKNELSPPATKRRKTIKASSGKAADSGSKDAAKAPSRRLKGREDLSIILTLPLDIVYEILSCLSPTDLFSIAKANRSWRKLVLGSQAGLVWKAARLSVEGCPAPPEEYSEIKWASFLFGSRCQSCGGRANYDIRDWRLLRRACPTCKRRHLVDERLITERRFPGVSKEILKYLPFTQFSGWDWKPNQPEKFFWDEDITRIAAHWDGNQKHPTAKDSEEGAAINKKRDELLRVYRAWQSGILAARRAQDIKDRVTRLEAFKARFVDAGYSKQDVDKALHTWTDGIFYGTPNVTNSAWSRIRPRLEQKVQSQVNTRLAEELKPTVENRLKIFEGVYMTYLDTLRPSERLCCPPVAAFHPIPAVLKLLEASKERSITAKSFQPLKGRFKTYIADHRATVRESLVKSTTENQEKGKHAESPWDLARFVYRRSRSLRRKGARFLDWAGPENSVLVGWSMIGTHATLDQKQHQLRDGVWISVPAGFDCNQLASTLSVKLIELAGLDSRLATVAEMDEWDARFVCPTFFTEVGYPVFTWRSALALYDSLLIGASYEECFRLATPEEEAYAKESETELRAGAKAWSCNHCPDFLEAPAAGSKSTIVDHLDSVHGISQPTIPEDYFVNERCRHTYETPVEFPTPTRDVELFRCVCNTCRRHIVKKRRFTMEGILQHYAWMRGQPPVLGTDYVAVAQGGDTEQPEGN